jgi:hypothetical protein
VENRSDVSIDARFLGVHLRLQVRFQEMGLGLGARHRLGPPWELKKLVHLFLEQLKFQLK